MDMFGVCLHLRSHDFYGGSFQKEAMTLPTWALDYPPLEAEGLVIQVGITLIVLLLSSDMGTIWANIHILYIYILYIYIFKRF